MGWKKPDCGLFLFWLSLHLDMKETAKSILKYTLSFLLMGGLLFFSFRGIDWKQFWSSIQACRWEWILLSMAAGYLTFILRGARWQMQLLPIDAGTRFRTAYDAVNIGYLFNLVLPRAGELIKCLYVTKHSSKKSNGERLATYDKVVGTMVLDRSWDVLSGAVIIIILLILLWTSYGDYLYNSIRAGLAAKKGLFLVAILLAVAGVLFCILVWALRKKGGFFGRVWKFIAGMGVGFTSCFRMKRTWLFVVYTLLIWFCYWVMMYTVILALKDVPAFASFGATDAIFLMLVGTVSTLIPVPGGFGAYHAFLLATLSSVYDIPASIGISLAILAHESEALVQLLAGLVSYVTDNFRKD